MRKNLYTTGLVLVLALVSCNRNRVEVSGTISGEPGSTLTLERLDVNRTTVVDSVATGSAGGFSLSARLEEPELFVLKHQNGQLINLLLAPGDRVRVSAEASGFGSEYELEGSEESENIRQLVRHMQHTRSVLDSLMEVASAITDPDSPHMDLVRSAYTKAVVTQKRYTIRYLVEHMHSLSSVYALYQKYDRENLVLGRQEDLQYFKTLADSLEISHPNSTLTQSLRSDIRQREATFEEEKQMNALIGMAGEPAGSLDLSIPDRDGNEVSLSSLNGKVVLLVFWAAGNEESVSSLLALQSTYERYHPQGFEVYAVSLDNNRQMWINSIDFNEFDWINVSELSYPDSRADRIYNVTALPTSYLVDSNGDVVAKNLYGKTLETWLDNLL